MAWARSKALRNRRSQHDQMLAWLKSLGFKTPDRTWHCRSADELVAAIDELDRVRRELRLRNRRRGHQAELLRAARSRRLHLQGAALGHRVQVRRRAGRDAAQGHHRPGRPHRRADAGGGARTGVPGRQHHQPRHAPQRRLHPPEGHPHRRHGEDREGRRSHSGGRGRGVGQADGQGSQLPLSRRPAPSAAPRSRARPGSSRATKASSGAA